MIPQSRRGQDTHRAWLQNPAAGHNDWPLWINLKGRSGSSIPTVDERRRSNLRPDLTLADRSGLDYAKTSRSVVICRGLHATASNFAMRFETWRLFTGITPNPRSDACMAASTMWRCPANANVAKLIALPPPNQKQSRPQAGFVMPPRATTRPRHFMQAEASFPTAITACSISGDHGLL